MTEIKEVTYIHWYIKHRTKIWGTIFFIVGLLGGNVDRIIKYLPSLANVVENSVQNSEKIIDKQENLEYNSKR